MPRTVKNKIKQTCPNDVEKAWKNHTDHDVYLWTKLCQLDFSEQNNTKPKPVLVESEVFNFMYGSSKGTTVVRCDANQKPLTKRVFNELPIERDWVMIPFGMTYDKEYSHRAASECCPCIPHAALYVVDRYNKVSYIFDSHTDLELLTIQSENAENPIPLPGKRSFALDSLQKSHETRVDRMEDVNKLFRSHLKHLYNGSKISLTYLGRIFLRPKGNGCNLALMKAIELLQTGYYRPETDEELLKLQPKWRTLPSSGPFWDHLKLKLGDLQTKRKRMKLKETTQYYKVGHQVKKRIELEFPPPPFLQYKN